jgi:hypothetical protein
MQEEVVSCALIYWCCQPRCDLVHPHSVEYWGFRHMGRVEPKLGTRPVQFPIRKINYHKFV